MDPRKPGSSKGGYLEGSIQLPKNFPGDLRIVISTVPDPDVQGGVGEKIWWKIPGYSARAPHHVACGDKGRGEIEAAA